MGKVEKDILKRVLVGVSILAVLWVLLTLVVGIDERRFPTWLVDIVQTPLWLIDKYGHILIFSLPGILLALVVLVPPIRTLTHRNPKARKLIILSIGLLSLLIMFAVWTLFAVYVTFFVATVPCCLWETVTEVEREAYQVNQSIIIQELWFRVMVPPPLRSPCYTSEVEICVLADNVLEYPSITPITTWSDYLLRVVIFLPSASVGVGLAWLFTRQKEVFSEGELPTSEFA